MASAFATHHPLWERVPDHSRKDRVLLDDRLLLATDFEGANGVALTAIGPDHYQLELESEPGNHAFSGWGYYFCFGIRNCRSEQRRVTIRLLASTRDRAFAVGTRSAVIRRGDTWNELGPDAIDPLDPADGVDLRLHLPGANDPDPVLFVSNFHWWPWSELHDWLHGLPDVRLVEIGRSREGRPLIAVEFGDPALPCMVHAATSQPSEMGHLQCRALIDWLRDASSADIRHRFHVCVIPCTNPDGAVQGYGLSDAAAGFPFFEAQLAAEDSPDASPENRAVWDYLVRHRPHLFWEWHSNNWDRRPGHMLLRFRHELIPDPARRMWDQIEDQILALPNTHHGNWTGPEEGLYHDTIGYQAVTRLGAIACMIKQHDKFPLAQSQAHVVACTRIAAGILGA